MQSMAATATPGGDEGVDPRLLVRVIGQWRFLVGIGLDLCGFGVQLAALHAALRGIGQDQPLGFHAPLTTR